MDKSEKKKKTQKQYNENYKPLLREIKEDINKFNDIPYSRDWILTIFKISILLEVTYRFNVISVGTLYKFASQF